MLIQWKKLNLIALACCVAVGLSGCGKLWGGIDFPDPEAELRNRGATTSGVSAAAGAVVGATAGLIIGSTSGHAGEGLVLGTIAGATTGGLVGSKLEGYEAEIDEKSEAITRQEEVITNQWREIDSLKKQLEKIDTRPSVNNENYSLDTYDGSPKAKSWNEYNIDIPKKRVAPVPSKASKSRASLRARSASLPKAVTTPKKVVRKRPIAVVKKAPVIDVAKTKKPALPKARVVKKKTPTPIKSVRKVAKKQEPIKVARKAPAVKVTPKKEIAKVKSKPEPTVASLATTKVTSTGCTKAAEEAERAAATTSNADKLFYLRRALRLCPKEAKYHLQAGEVYASIGRKDDAEFEFRRTIELDPENEAAHEQLMLLESQGA